MQPEVGLSGLLLDYPFSGTAVYTRNLVPLLPQVASDLLFRLYVRQTPEVLSGVAVERVSSPFAALSRGRGAGARLDKLAWEVISLPISAARHGDALLHSLYFAAPALASCKVIVTIHDLIPLILPSYHRSWLASLYSRFMALTARRAAAIITVSHCSKRDIVRLLRVPDSRVHVTYEAVDARFHPGRQQGEEDALRLKYGLPERFLLYTGGAERRKNLETLVRAWERVAGAMRAREVRLVIVARFPPPEPLYPDIPGLAAELGLQDDIRFISQVDEADKPVLYRASLVFCFPSRYEGFGFTPLEAMASGVPVVGADAASIPEVVGTGALLLPPDDINGWAEAMLHLVDSERGRSGLIKQGLHQAARFSWRRTAEQTVSVYRQVLGS